MIQVEVASPGVASTAETVAPHVHARVPALDGLRGLTVLMVLLFHGLRWHIADFPGGTAFDRWLSDRATFLWVGVDLFFVLSGFLITGILLETRRSPDRYRSFYGRRVLRIMPLYQATVAIVLLALPWAGIDPGAAETPWGKMSYFLFLQNYGFALDGFRTPCLAHLWSLAIEEQFYLVWPFVVFASGRRRLAWTATGLVALSATVRYGAKTSGLSAMSNYVNTYTRLDGLAVGALLALAVGSGSVGVRRAVAWGWPAGAVATAGAAWMLCAEMNFVYLYPARQAWGYVAVALTGGALVALCVQPAPANPFRTAMGWGWLQALGRLSYGIYVLHVPLDQVVGPWFWNPRAGGRAAVMNHVAFPTIFYTIGLIGTSVLVAKISWLLLEAPALRLKRYFSYRPQ